MKLIQKKHVQATDSLDVILSEFNFLALIDQYEKVAANGQIVANKFIGMISLSVDLVLELSEIDQLAALVQIDPSR